MPTIFRDKVTVGEVTFNDSTALPLAGTTEWGLDVLLGWKETPDVEGEFSPKGLVDGEVPGEFFPIRGRQLSVGGYVEAVDRATADQLLDIIIGDAFPRNKFLEMTRYEPVPKFVRGWRNGPVDSTWVGPRAFRWAVSFRCDDPFKYGLSSSSDSTGVAGSSSGGRTYPRTYPLEYNTVAGGEGNSIAFNNIGTASTSRWTAELHGPLTNGGWRISNDTTGEFIRVNIGLSSTDIVVIDFEQETVTMNGTLISASITGDFFSLPRGVSVLKLYADFDPAASWSMTAYPAWE